MKNAESLDKRISAFFTWILELKNIIYVRLFAFFDFASQIQVEFFWVNGKRDYTNGSTKACFRAEEGACATPHKIAGYHAAGINEESKAQYGADAFLCIAESHKENENGTD